MATMPFFGLFYEYYAKRKWQKIAETALCNGFAVLLESSLGISPVSLSQSYPTI